MTNEQSHTDGELKQRLDKAEAMLHALRSGQMDTIAGEQGTLVVRLAEAQAREEHIKQVLLAIRNVDQLIVSEDDPLQLIKRACLNLTETMGYFNTWIALLDEESGVVTATACSGFGGDFTVLDRRLEAGVFTDCMKRTLEGDGTVVIRDPRTDCLDCPLSCEYAGRSGLSHSLRHGGRTYGILSVSVSPAYAFNEEEQGLFNELAGDLAFALHKIEAGKHQRQNQAMLSRTEQIANIGSWEWNIANDRVRWSEGLFRIFQRDPAGGAPSFAEHSELYVAEDMHLLRQAVERCVADGTPYELELRARRTDGAIRHCVARGQAETDLEGKIYGLAGSLQDITDRKQLEERIALMGRMLDEAPASITIHDTDGRFLFANHQTLRLHGYETEEEFLAVNLHDLDVPESEAKLAERLRRISETGEARFETAHYRKDGAILPLEVIATTINWNSRPAIFSIATDVTERKRADEVLRESEERNRLLSDMTMEGILLHKNAVAVDLNLALANMLGVDREELLKRELMEFVHADDRSLVMENIVKDYAPPYSVRLTRNTGELFWAEIESRNFHKKGDLLRVSAIRDITERKQAEDALKRSENEKAILNQIASIFLTVPDEAMYEEVLAVVLQATKSRFGIFGYIAETGDLVIPSLSRDIWSACQIPDKSIVFPSDSWGASLWGRAIREKTAFCSDGPFCTPEGHIHIDHFFAVPVVYGQETIGLISVANREGGYTREDRDFLEYIVSRVSPILNARLQRDVQERRRRAAERNLMESEEKYRLLITNAEEAIFIVQDDAVTFPNPKALEMSGYSIEELAGISFLDLVHPSDREAVFEGHLKQIAGMQPEPFPFRIIDKKGKERWVELTSARIIWEKKPGILCFLRDVTEEKKLETRLIQAQKTESLGRLAGGVAHDFNNMLTIIIGNTEIALMNVPLSDPLHARLQNIDNAARRSADLTRQLLAFARKQTIAPKVLNMNDTVSGMLQMLQRLIGEDIDLAWRPGAELWPVKIDPSQIDQVLANLCVNARDAIAGVGKVTVETGNIVLGEDYCATRLDSVPGEFVLLAVSDDGCGMDEEIRAHLFEPFFTTKGVGEGTGLGLATVYGIVKQNDGFINVYSEPGQGTTFKIYFPVHKGKPDEALLESVSKKLPGGRETILVVEDEEAILDISKKILEKLGYTVLIARTPGEAIQLVKENSVDIHLLLTDVVMPGMNGRDLLDRVASIRPGLKSLYMSGYTANVIAHRGILEEGVHFIQKPFSMKDLAAKVREVLDQKSTDNDDAAS